jgi:hypothetical protein
MAPEWAAAYRPLVIAFTVINLIVTWCFRADVTAQGGAYATGVLVLMTSAAIGSLVDIHRHPLPTNAAALFRRRASLVGFGVVSVVFIYTTLANIAERPDGIIIASIFIGCVLALSMVSRFWRAEEMRLKEFRFADDAARMLWTDICLDGTFLVLGPTAPASGRWRRRRRRSAASIASRRACRSSSWRSTTATRANSRTRRLSACGRRGISS